MREKVIFSNCILSASKIEITKTRLAHLIYLTLDEQVIKYPYNTYNQQSQVKLQSVTIPISQYM